MTTPRTATILVAQTKQEMSHMLEQELLRLDDNVKHVALSGGSLPSILSPAMQQQHSQFQKWHVYLADERCVPSSHPDSNLGALLSSGCLQQQQQQEAVYGIDETLLHDPHACAEAYERIVPPQLDLALLGFGPDGHTCSLFPGHALLMLTEQHNRRVAAILDSPKPPAHRITLTLKALSQTRHVIFVGAGASKATVLEQVLESSDNVQWEDEESFGWKRGTVRMRDPPPFPCGAVSPQQTLTWIVDQEAYPHTR